MSKRPVALMSECDLTGISTCRCVALFVDAA